MKFMKFKSLLSNPSGFALVVSLVSLAVMILLVIVGAGADVL